jgi:hypothetical protein
VEVRILLLQQKLITSGLLWEAERKIDVFHPLNGLVAQLDRATAF